MLKTLFSFEGFKDTMRRFPYSVFFSVALFFLCAPSLNELYDGLDKALYGRIVTLCVFGFFWFGCARLLCEGLGLSRVRERVVSYGVFAVFSGVLMLESGKELVLFLTILTPALWLGISVAPYLKGRDDLSLWFFNNRLWTGVGVAILVGIVWGGGVSAALASIQYLFGVKVDGDVYGDVWMLAVCVFGPLHALTWIPKSYQFKEEDCKAAPQLAFGLNWVMAPLVVVYMLILYAYFAKIAIVQELPRGQLAYMISAFGGVGVLTYLAGWPLRKEGGPVLRFMYKAFFPALIVPVIVQAFSIYLRVEQYGITEQRYIIMLSTVWMAFAAVGYSFFKLPLKYMLGLLCVLLMMASIGPLSAINVSERSQMGRLEALLVKNGILQDKVLRKAPEEVSFEDRADISSILQYLKRSKKLERVKERWLVTLDLAAQESNKAAMKLDTPEGLANAMGFDFIRSHYNGRRPQFENFNLNSEDKVDTNVSGYKVFLQQQRVFLNRRRAAPGQTKLWSLNKNRAGFVDAYYEDDVFYVGLRDRGFVSFDVQGFALAEYKRDSSRDKRDMVLEKTENGMRVKLIFRNINLFRDAGDQDAPYALNGFSFKALIDY